MGKSFEKVIEWTKNAGLETEIGERSLIFRKPEGVEDKLEIAT